MRASALAAALALAAAGCGSGAGTGGTSATAPPAGAKALFVQQCGACHKLADAGTEGVVGKSLDDVRPTRAAVLRAIADGPKTMPPNLVRGGDARAVAAYVARVAGR